MQTPFPHCEIWGTVTILFTLLSEGAPFSPASCPEYKLDFCSQHLLSTYYRLHSIHISTDVFLGTQAQPCPPHFCSRSCGSWRLSRGDPKQGLQRSLALNLSLSASNPSTKYSLHTRPAFSRRAGVGWGTKNKRN